MPSRPVEELEPTLCGDIDKLAARLQKDGITDSLETTHRKETREGGSSAIGDMTLETILRTVLHAVTGSVFVAFVADLLGGNPRRRNARISDSFRTLRAIRAILAS